MPLVIDKHEKIYSEDIIKDLIFIHDKAHCSRTHYKADKKFAEIKDQLDPKDAEELKNLLIITDVDYPDFSIDDRYELSMFIREVVNRGSEHMPPVKDKLRKVDAERYERQRQMKEALTNIESKREPSHISQVYNAFIRQTVERQIDTDIKDCVLNIVKEIEDTLTKYDKFTYDVYRNIPKEIKNIDQKHKFKVISRVFAHVIGILTLFDEGYNFEPVLNNKGEYRYISVTKKRH